MKTITLLKYAAPALLLISGSALAQVSLTPHNMVLDGTYDNSGNTGGQICVYCHTPHNASLTVLDGPLWNRTAGAVGPFTMYSSGTIQGTIDATPNAETLACMGCHDGVVAIDSLVNNPGDDTVVWGATVGPLLGYALLDSDFSNDHPISITYEPGLDGELELQTVPEGDGLEFYGAGTNKVECATCHDVHGTGLPQMLRVTSDGSAICLSCHIK